MYVSNSLNLIRGDVPTYGIQPFDIKYSNGTYCSSPPGGQPAFFPTDHWNHFTDLIMEEMGLKSYSVPLLHSAITLVDLDSDTLQFARNEIIDQIITNAPGFELSQRIMLVRNRIEDRLESEYGIECLEKGPADCIIHRSGLISTAFNYDTGKFVGLHIDNHQKLKNEERHLSHILVSINIGSSYRYFQFVNLSVLKLLNAIELKSDDIPVDTVLLKEKFLSKHPQFPVIRVCIKPGQAYICNAQNIIHDGATNKEGMPDISLLMSGLYQWKI